MKFFYKSFFIFLLMCSFSALHAEIVGATKGSVDVSQGSLTYDMEILTPKGIAGLKPSLGINYNSSNSINSFLGTGFSLTGLSSIIKCNQSLFSEKNDSSRTYNYCLDGQRLLLVDTSDVYGSTDSEYRTEINTFSKIIKKSNAWEVFTKDGLIYEYGNSSDSKDGESFFRVNQIKDRYDNKILFTYASTNNERFITNISYANNQIDFIYEDRDDKRNVFSNGIKSNISKRLKSIVVKTDNQKISSYNLNYDFLDNKSKITSIQECVKDDCLKPVDFTWTLSNDETYKNYHLWQASGEGTQSNNYITGSDTSGVYSALMDMNGDGLPDRVSAKNYKTGETGLHVALNNGNGFDAMQLWYASGQGPHTNNYITGSDTNGVYSALMDMNGDGLPDRVGHHNYKTGVNGLHVALNTGSGFGEFKLWLPSGQGPHTNNYITGSNTSGTYSALIDMNGDGLPDRVGHYNYKTKVAGLFVALNTGSGFGEFKLWLQSGQGPHTNNYITGSNSSGTYSGLADMNGDGLPDRVGHHNYKTGVDGLHVALNTGSGFGEFKLWQASGEGTQSNNYITGSDTSGVYSALMDMNGDGLPDRVSAKNYKTGETGLHVALNNGNGFDAMQLWYASGQGPHTNNYITGSDTNGVYSALMDMNGDGLPDRVGHHNYKTGVNGLHVALNTGSGFGEFKLWLPSGQGPHTNNYITGSNTSGTYSDLIDLNGDGFVDRVGHYNYATSTAGLFVAFSPKVQTPIHTISNHKDQNVNVTYTTLRDSEVYTPYSDAAYPNIDLKANSMGVVKSFRVADGIGGENETTFKYEGFKINGERGSLGFAKVETYNELSKSKSISNFMQFYPFIGVTSSSESYINNTKVSDSDSTLNIAKLHENQDILNLQTIENIQNKYDIDGTLLLESITRNSDFDKYGNIGKIESITQKDDIKYEKITQSNYINHEDSWILSRLINASVTHMHTDGSSIIKHSAFEYDDITGTLNKEIIEPQSENVLAKSYGYDKYGNKISETITASSTEPRTTKFIYDNQGKNIIQAVNPLNQTEQREYDINNRVVKVTGPNGLSTSFAYDGMGRKILETRADGTTTTWTHSWDESFPNSMYKVVETSTGTTPVETYFDTLNRKLRVTKIGFDGSKIYQDAYYNALGQVEKTSNPYYAYDLPDYTYNEYDDLGRQTKLTRTSATGEVVSNYYEYDGLNVTITNAKGQKKTTISNIIGKKTKIIEGDGTFIEYKYDAFGNLKETRDSKNNIIQLKYDIYGNKIYMDDPDMGIWHYAYNSLGELVSQTDAKGQTTTMEYDHLGRMVKRIEPEGETSWIYDIAAHGIGKLAIEKTDFYKKEYFYDKYTRVIESKEYADNKLFSTKFTYTTDGKLDKTIRPDGFETKNEYNTQGYLSAVKSPIKGDREFSYEEIKNLIKTNLNNKQNAFDKIMQLNTQVELYRAKSLQSFALAKEYESKNTAIKDQLEQTAKLLASTAVELQNMATKTETNYNIYDKNLNYYLNKLKQYDDENLYKWLMDTFQSSTTTLIDQSLQKLDDAKAILDSISDEDSLNIYKDISSAYINQSKRIITQAKNDIELYKNYKDKYATLTTGVNKAYQGMFEDDAYKYYYKILNVDVFGRITKDIVGNGLVTLRDYNKSSGQLNSIQTGYDGKNDVRDMKYTYDVLDNVVSKDDYKQNISQNFTYDNLDRVTSASNLQNGVYQNILYEYDNIGNITKKSDVGDYTYTKAHQVTNAGSHKYTYDANGNVVKKDNITITFSSYNKPIMLEDDKNKTQFFYAPNRARYKKVLNGNSTYYVGKLYEQENTQGIIKYKNFIYANNQLIALHIEEDDGKMILPQNRYMHKDALGSIDTITNESGQVIKRMTYKPFGQQVAQEWINEASKAVVTKRGFTGHEHITEFNLIHMNGRVYDPVTGRFLSADPTIQAPYDTQSYNRYTYVKNNPLKYTDPSGYSWFKKVFHAIGKVFKAIKKYIKVIVAIVVTVVIAIYAPYLLGMTETWGFAAFATLSLENAMIIGAISGFVSGFIMTGTLSGAVKGAVWGAISAGVAHGIGHAEALKNMRSALGGAGQHIMHGITRAAITKAQGGRWSSGFWSGLAGSALGATMGKLENLHIAIKTAINSLASGMISKISGGKFANGAVTGAFVYLFNHTIDELTDTSNLTKEQRDMVIKNYDEAKKFVQMQKLKNYDLPLEDVSYVFLPVGRVVGRDAWNFQLRNASVNNQLIVDAVEAYFPGVPAMSTGGSIGGIAGNADNIEYYYNKVKKSILDFFTNKKD
ncbi:RHS repeat-associated core domain-containing protein [Arcobacter sp.]|uniref:RHS repeat-associated core domain-containing protein n=1 Tax=unclassified Arcobacter TaxID=2593671 RepID=UPI003B0050E8